MNFDDKIISLKAGLKGLLEYPAEKLENIIKDIGFECDLCGKCCTKEFNDHAFLLESDADRVKEIEPAALIPAPYYEYCDQYGRFYVSGYSLRFHPDGTCHFLDSGRCRIYEDRPSICRIYPYMLHREEGEDGKVDWRQISGLDRHGLYDAELDESFVKEMARETIEYEKAFLEQEINFHVMVKERFMKNCLRHVKSFYDRRMRQFMDGAEIEVFVYHKGSLEKNIVKKADYEPLIKN